MRRCQQGQQQPDGLKALNLLGSKSLAICKGQLPLRVLVPSPNYFRTGSLPFFLMGNCQVQRSWGRLGGIEERKRERELSGGSGEGDGGKGEKDAFFSASTTIRRQVKKNDT